jgi:ribosomal protein S18 acetylase RimI-like enzyme
MQALNGFALLRGERVIGYSYFVCEENKGLIGDLYVIDEERTIEHENALMGSVLDAMWQTPGVRRVESQLMMIRSPLDRSVPQPSRFHSFPRVFLELGSGAAERLAQRETERASILPWTEARQDATARLMAHSYQGHIDSLINDQYRSPSGARRFLSNIIQFPGCGTFYQPASFLAIDQSDGSLCGVSLASMVAHDVGHITQVCVSPAHRGTGLGYELLRRSLDALGAHGCRSTSLTVTTSNETAVQLYKRMGFTTRKQFAAYSWELR